MAAEILRTVLNHRGAQAQAEEYGKETVPTFYNRFRESEPFFLDYAFTNVEVKKYKTYSWDESNRMSDHVPIEVEIK